jgi:hypothetical protein
MQNGFIFPQGLKPDFFYPLYGTAEAVPLQIKIKTKIEEGLASSFLRG